MRMLVRMLLAVLVLGSDMAWPATGYAADACTGDRLYVLPAGQTFLRPMPSRLSQPTAIPGGTRVCVLSTRRAIGARGTTSKPRTAQARGWLPATRTGVTPDATPAIPVWQLPAFRQAVLTPTPIKVRLPRFVTPTPDAAIPAMHACIPA